MSLPSRLRRNFAMHVVRPYVRRELPAWGRLYSLFIGGYAKDDHWQGIAPRWMRGKLHGYEMLLDLSRWSPRKTFFLGRFYDLGTQSILQALLREGDTFVDIGANEGMISLLATRLVGPSGKVISFEPNPTPRAKIEAAIQRNAIETIDLRAIGLASEEAELVLSVPKINNGEASFGRPGYAEDQIEKVICPVKIGDDELNGVTPRLIKIDVEGFETRVLRGLSQVLGGSQPFVITEVVGDHLRRADSSVEAMQEVISRHGYKPWAVHLVRVGIGHRLKLEPASLHPGYRGDVLWIPDSRAEDPALRPYKV